MDSIKYHSGALVEEPGVGVLAEEDERAAGVQAAEPSNDLSAADILADLTALQREVDALRGQYVKEPATGDA